MDDFVCALRSRLLGGSHATEPDAPDSRVDYLTFAQGALPLEVSGSAAALGTTLDKAIAAIDGNPLGFVLNRKFAPPDAEVIFVYELPAATTFDRFAVPNVLETPSPSQTFTRRVEVLGSATGPSGRFSLLAAADLTTHPAKGQVTELPILNKTAVRWVKVRLLGGIDVRGEKSFFEFSEIIGNGTQDSAPLAQGFSGAWRGRGVQIGMRQEGAAVAGCYDTRGRLDGTVTGKILRATGADAVTGVKSLFVLALTDGGDLRGLRSTNGAPFAPYDAAASGPEALRCSMPDQPTLGCDAVIHGISFDFDAATLRPESAGLLAQLHQGLAATTEQIVRIEGHTSSEGGERYNQALSERRAQSVVDDLVGRGIERSRLIAVGHGERYPLASNDDEAGRSMNRRVEVHCGPADTP